MITLQVVVAVWLLPSVAVIVAGYVPGAAVAFPETTPVVELIVRVPGRPL